MDTIYTYTSLIIFGALWGSFFYTLAHRYANPKYRDNFKKIFYEASHCQNCQTKVKYLYLIPVFGYLLSRGRCSSCGAKFSFTYPLFEIVFALLSVTLYNYSGFSLATLITFFILSIAITISIIDYKIKEIPDSLLVVFFILSLYRFFMQAEYLESLLGFTALSIVFLVVILIFPGGFGGGDLKYAGCLGFYVGLAQSVILLEVALISGTIVGIMYGVLSKKGLRIKIAFGPFLSLGLFVSEFFGQEILLIYYALFT